MTIYVHPSSLIGFEESSTEEDEKASYEVSLESPGYIELSSIPSIYQAGPKVKFIPLHQYLARKFRVDITRIDECNLSIPEVFKRSQEYLEAHQRFQKKYGNDLQPGGSQEFWDEKAKKTVREYAVEDEGGRFLGVMHIYKYISSLAPYKKPQLVHIWTKSTAPLAGGAIYEKIQFFIYSCKDVVFFPNTEQRPFRIECLSPVEIGASFSRIIDYIFPHPIPIKESKQA